MGLGDTLSALLVRRATVSGRADGNTSRRNRHHLSTGENQSKKRHPFHQKQRTFMLFIVLVVESDRWLGLMVLLFCFLFCGWR